MSCYFIGLSITYHDPALAIINAEGEVLYAEATERLLQYKRALHCPPDGLPWIEPILKQYCPAPTQFVIALNWRRKRPLYENIVAALGCLKADGLLKKGIKRLCSPLPNYQLHHMVASQRNHIVAGGLNCVRMIAERFPDCEINIEDFDHHLTHAATACYNSAFEEAACAVVDSFGENGSMGFYHFKDGALQLLHETRGVGSLGFYYMKLTELCGFDWLKGEEWKVMGLAPYGRLNTDIYQLLKKTIRVEGFHCHHHTGHLNTALSALEAYRRKQDDFIETAADLAFTGQYFFAEIMSQLLQHLQQQTGSDNLCLAGGCGLNSAYNGQITEKTDFKQVYIPSAPADDGTALGAAWLAFHKNAADKTGERSQQILSPYLGSEMDEEALQRLIQYNRSLNIQHLPEDICRKTAEYLAQGCLVAWVQGRAEYGPRALGNRSILADPRNAKVKDKINQDIKFRERFRPFAPSILEEYGEEYFINYQPSPYMDKTLLIRDEKQATIAGVCHEDGTGRLQSVKKSANPKFYRLIECFSELTGVPVLLNTSFNVMGKPLAHSVEDAIAIFLTTGLDVLVIGDYLITKTSFQS